MYLIDRPIITKTYNNLESIEIENDSVYLYGQSLEDRADISTLIQTASKNIKYIKLNINNEETTLSVHLKEILTVNLNDENSINNFFSHFQEKNFYLDITGLTHSAWAPLIKFFFKT
ncbi:hypothetical protein QWY26_05090 [Acinetobacter baumannii]|uniref:hypothetical protein n=1 Tax=Acinetobacter baumannii TaxID=470 RepID=UPI00261AFF79|nr:hypothetical protein [Acinetobacter baumannii]WKA72664.1 hypothetical protein QWY26_05090 [Acinetobacter baumannii]